MHSFVLACVNCVMVSMVIIMKDINALFWHKCEAGQPESDFLRSANVNKIFDEFYMTYVQPNAAAFKKNYCKNCSMLDAVGYDECTLDFIPITDEEFVMVDNQNRCFCGTFIARPYKEDSKIERSIFSILIADEWDIRKVMPVILEKRWSYVYFVLNQEAKEFASFFKLKEFLATLPPNVKFFATTEEMRQYFLSDHDAYLPRRIVASEPEKYETLFEEIHDARIQSGIPSNNVFLSICIPTYNRGELALKAVKNTLSMEFDAEIEVFVSDNGSTIEKEAYEEIANMQDSRIRYYRAKENGGIVFNVMNCLRRARGHFALFLSDEDPLVVENVGTALEWLIQRAPIAGCIFSCPEGNICYHYSEEKVSDSGVDAVARALDSGYLSGTCLNLAYIKAQDLFAEIEKFKENEFFKLFPYSVMMALSALRFDFITTPVILWKPGEKSKIFDWNRVNGVPVYMLPENMVRQQRDIIKTMAEYLSGDDLKTFFLDSCLVRLFEISVCYKYEFADSFREMYRWIDIWTTHYRGCLQILQDMKGKLGDITSIIPEMDKYFLDWMICKRRQRLQTPEENLLPSLQAQVAKYYYDKGTAIEDIDFDQIEKDLEGWVQNFLENRT